MQVQSGVLPPQLAPGDLLYTFVEKPAGRRRSPKQPVPHGSEVQHPMNFDPAWHAYLNMLELLNQPAQFSFSGSEDRSFLMLHRALNLPSPPRRTEKVTWGCWCVVVVCHYRFEYEGRKEATQKCIRDRGLQKSKARSAPRLRHSDVFNHCNEFDRHALHTCTETRWHSSTWRNTWQGEKSTDRTKHSCHFSVLTLVEPSRFCSFCSHAHTTYTFPPSFLYTCSSTSTAF